MKKTLIAVLLAFAAFSLVYAGGNQEKLIVLEGTVVSVSGEDGSERLMLRKEDGSLVQIGIGEAERDRLRLKDRDRIRISGVYIGSTGSDGEPARILARTMTRDGTRVKLEEPLQLTERDRERIRECEEEEEKLQIQNQTRTNAENEVRTEAGSDAGSGTGSGPGSGETAGKK